MKQFDFSYKFFLNFIFECYVKTKKICSMSREKIDQKGLFVCLRGHEGNWVSQVYIWVYIFDWGLLLLANR